eukprot:g16125.t1
MAAPSLLDDLATCVQKIPPKTRRVMVWRFVVCICMLGMWLILSCLGVRFFMPIGKMWAPDGSRCCCRNRDRR